MTRIRCAAVFSFMGVAGAAMPSPAWAEAPAINHDGVGCIVVDQFPRLEARFDPVENVSRGRLRFRPTGGAHWYSVPMKKELEAFVGVLPKPTSKLKSLDYYVEVTATDFATGRTQEYVPEVVSGIGACQGDKITAGSLGSASVILEVPAGAPAVPAGFSNVGIVSAAAPGGGGGLGTTALVVGGVVVAGGAAAAVLATGGNDGPAGGGGAGTPATTQPPAPTAPQPGTGDIAFRLTWNTTADLDIYVQEPNGNVIYFAAPTSPSGGRLDVDSNANCPAQSTNPVENIFWPTGQAPRGTYVYWVQHFGCGPASAFTMQVLRGGAVAAVQSGNLNPTEQSTRFAFQF